MRKHSICSLYLAVCVIITNAVIASAQDIDVYTDADMEQLLKDKAAISIDLPTLGYTMREADIMGSLETGSIKVATLKIIYYLIHWGPVEVNKITPEYVRDRIPKIWPSEGLNIQIVRPATVAGHPAYYVEAIPRRLFYRAQFLIWNCPQTGRQFIADMNYNVQFKTPRSELQAQIDATEKTLACHPGAPISPVPGHVVRYDEPRFGISFSHPLRWYVFESPYGVPHPEYVGLRDNTIGSLLAWLKDRYVEIMFFWQPITEAPEGEITMIGDSAEKLQAAVDLVNGMEDVESFSAEASETLSLGGNKLLKVMGIVTRKKPEKPSQGFILKGRAEVLLIDSERSNRRLFVVVRVNNYLHNGISKPPDRDIFDRWTLDIVRGLEF